MVMHQQSWRASYPRRFSEQLEDPTLTGSNVTCCSRRKMVAKIAAAPPPPPLALGETQRKAVRPAKGTPIESRQLGAARPLRTLWRTLSCFRASRKEKATSWSGASRALLSSSGVSSLKKSRTETSNVTFSSTLATSPLLQLVEHLFLTAKRHPIKVLSSSRVNLRVRPPRSVSSSIQAISRLGTLAV